MQELLEKASDTADYDVTVAAEQLLKVPKPPSPPPPPNQPTSQFVVSEQSSDLQELVVCQAVDLLDQLAIDVADLGLELFASPASLAQVVEQVDRQPPRDSTQSA